MEIKNITKGSTLCTDCRIADTFFKRLLGLMGKKNLPKGSGLLIMPCNSIHMFFMKFPLDIIFIDKDQKIAHLIENIKPWQFSKIILKSYRTIELPAGTIDSTKTSIDDFLQIIR